MAVQDDGYLDRHSAQLPFETERADVYRADAAVMRRDLGVWMVFLTLDTLTQLAFKAGGEALAGIELGHAWLSVAGQTPAVWLAVAGYITLFVVWLVILQNSELTRAFTMTGVAYVTVPLGGWLVFGERITLVQVLGILLIIAGVTMISRQQRD